MLAFTTLLLLSATQAQAPTTLPPPVAASTTPAAGPAAPAVAGTPALDPKLASPTWQATPVPAPTPPSAEPSLSAPVPVDAQAPAIPTPVAPPILPPQGAAHVHAPRDTAPQTDIVIVGRARPTAGDPLENVNAGSFAATEKVDAAVVGPAARAYKRGIPKPIRNGIHNFLYNLREPVVFLNFLLQLKPGKAAETVGRFAINSTIGAAGLIDVAKRRPFRLPRRSNGFANTLGYHGVGNGPFLFLPLVGPTTVRDLVGGALDRLIMPVVFGKTFTRPSYAIPAGVLGALDHRAEFDETLEVLHEGTADPYAASRDFYLQRRQAEIDHLRGRRNRITGLDPASAARVVVPSEPAPDAVAPPAAPVPPTTAGTPEASPPEPAAPAAPASAGQQSDGVDGAPK